MARNPSAFRLLARLDDDAGAPPPPPVALLPPVVEVVGAAAAVEPVLVGAAAAAVGALVAAGAEPVGALLEDIDGSEPIREIGKGLCTFLKRSEMNAADLLCRAKL
mmetsp:Transcript_26683/g.82568  ORF Transcript_26683/g.82568 Transcript_26683/m.82568 type:complete len:106 (+) Transcript_26683:472-789(+)